LGTITIETFDSSVTIKKPDTTLDDLFESFVAACIGVGYDPEEIEKTIINLADALQKKNN
jgi:hypothetical protein